MRRKRSMIMPREQKLGFAALDYDEFVSPPSWFDRCCTLAVSKIPKSFPVNRVGLACQTFRSVQLIHLRQVFTRLIQVLPDVAPKTFCFKSEGRRPERFEYQ